MRTAKLFLAIILLALSTACKNKSEKTTTEKTEETEVIATPTIPEKIAYAHGFENWKNVKNIAFTFNVDRGENHYQRHWIWNTKNNTVTHINAEDTLTYNRSKMDSLAYKTNGGFVNDKFWLLAPYNLVWDAANYDYTIKEQDTAPISKKLMKKLTIVYGSEGGYTPGDAYDFYFEDDYLIKEWTFRKANTKEPSMSTTWENYLDIAGLKIAQDHKGTDKDFKLYFDGITIDAN
ncbi:hypothetical protein [Croceivirga radicis]|uniref:hypothetical protein n=1 Tax=Croceivirga radicis TaxID=1929488 RepID=UPI000255B88F|nr:hypothetical protein [Croceivirga radicis]